MHKEEACKEKNCESYSAMKYIYELEEIIIEEWMFNNDDDSSGLLGSDWLEDFLRKMNMLKHIMTKK